MQEADVTLLHNSPAGPVPRIIISVHNISRSSSDLFVNCRQHLHMPHKQASTFTTFTKSKARTHIHSGGPRLSTLQQNPPPNTSTAAHTTIALHPHTEKTAVWYRATGAQRLTPSKARHASCTYGLLSARLLAQCCASPSPQCSMQLKH